MVVLVSMLGMRMVRRRWRLLTLLVTLVVVTDNQFVVEIMIRTTLLKAFFKSFVY